MITLAKVTGMLYTGNGDVFYPRPYYRVGDILESTNPNNPADDGYIGTWELYGKGRVTVCVDENDTDFNAVGITTGEKKHTLTIEEMPKHTHTFPAKYGTTQTSKSVFTWELNCNDYNEYQSSPTGGSQSHNNIQPSIVVYRWRRIA